MCMTMPRSMMAQALTLQHGFAELSDLCCTQRACCWFGSVHACNRPLSFAGSGILCIAVQDFGSPNSALLLGPFESQSGHTCLAHALASLALPCRVVQVLRLWHPAHCCADSLRSGTNQSLVYHNRTYKYNSHNVHCTLLSFRVMIRVHYASVYHGV